MGVAVGQSSDRRLGDLPPFRPGSLATGSMPGWREPEHVNYNLGVVRMLLRFVEARGCYLDPGLFRVESPKKGGVALPRYLPEPEYHPG